MDDLPQMVICEEDLIKLIEEYLESREYHVTLRTLERESSVNNCDYSDVVLFVRDLVLDGDFEEVLRFGDSLKSLQSNEMFDQRRFNYIILRQKFIELIYRKAHVLNKQNIDTVGEVMRTLSKLEKHCETKEDYNNLCWLLTLPDLNTHEEFLDWNLDVSRLRCFKELLDCLSLFMPLVKRKTGLKKTASKDRLLQLMMKGLLYESCTAYCHDIVNNNDENKHFRLRSDLLEESQVDLHYSSNLVSWILGLPAGVFELPFNLCDMNICYSRPTSLVNKQDQILLNSSLDYRKEKKKLGRQLSDGPPQRNFVNLSSSGKSKSFDVANPKILSSSFPTSELRKGLNSYGHSQQFENRKSVSVLHSSLNIGKQSMVENKFPERRNDFGLTSPNVPPVMSSSAADMSPLVHKELMKVQEQGSILPHNSYTVDKRDIEAETKISYHEAVARTSYNQQSTRFSYDEPHYRPRSIADEQKLPTQPFPSTIRSADVRTSKDHAATTKELSPPSPTKKPVAFDVFEAKTPDKESEEKKRREEVMEKLKKHEQSRQDSMNLLLPEGSPGKEISVFILYLFYF